MARYVDTNIEGEKGTSVFFRKKVLDFLVSLGALPWMKRKSKYSGLQKELKNQDTKKSLGILKILSCDVEVAHAYGQVIFNILEK